MAIVCQIFSSSGLQAEGGGGGGTYFKKATRKLSSLMKTSLRKLCILAKDKDVAGWPPYLVLDFMHHIFPVTPGTVVAPYYPCINGMVYVQGDDEDTTWRGTVPAFSFRRCSVTGQFFKERDDEFLSVPKALEIKK